MPSNRVLAIVLLASSALVAGCAQTIRPPPAEVYQTPRGSTFDLLPPELRTTSVDVLYITDRKVETEDPLAYGIRRSKSLAYGSAIVELGPAETWEELVAWTESRPDASQTGLTASLTGLTELGRFPETPLLFDVTENGQIELVPELEAEVTQAREAAHAELRRRLALTPGGDVALYVHGIQNSLETAVIDSARINHLVGRFAVPVAYSWPAGGSGLLSAYAYDRESGEFTVHHLKQALRSIASIEEVGNLHLFAHSRGTDILTSALRELVIEIRAAGRNPREVLKVANVVLLAADLDIEVVGQRIVAEALGPAIGRITVYVSGDDAAIATAKDLFNSRARLGSVTPELLSERQKAVMRKSGNADIIVYQGTQSGGFGHGYFRNPAILADAVLMIQGDRGPGAENGRPLVPMGDHFWKITDSYLK